MVAEPSTTSPAGSGRYATTRLAGRDPAHRPAQLGAQPAAVEPRRSAGTALAVRAQLHLALDRAVRRGPPVHTGRSPSTVDTSSASAGPTVTVLVIGVIDST